MVNYMVPLHISNRENLAQRSIYLGFLPATMLMFFHSLPSSDVFLSSPFFFLFHQIRLKHSKQSIPSLSPHPTSLRVFLFISTCGELRRRLQLKDFILFVLFESQERGKQPEALWSQTTPGFSPGKLEIWITWISRNMVYQAQHSKGNHCN